MSLMELMLPLLRFALYLILYSRVRFPFDFAILLNFPLAILRVLFSALDSGVHKMMKFHQICREVGATVIVLSETAERRVQLQEKYNVSVFDSTSPDIGPAIRALQYDEVSILNCALIMNLSVFLFLI
jgi:hypothetical protein